MKKIATKFAVLGVMLLCGVVSSVGQNELIVAQYMHNYFAVNPAFAGSREGLSLFGSFRKQWALIENTPHSLLLTANTPMRHDKLTAGFSIYNQGILESSNTGFMATIGYRTHVTQNTWLGLALQPGVAIRSRDWGSVNLMDSQDEIFEDKESGAAPLLGVGVSFYGRKFFVGASTTTLFVCDDFEKSTAKFAPADATYMAMGGYWFDVTNAVALQPSFLLDYSKQTDMAVNISLSGIYREMIWLTGAYRTNKEINIGTAVKPSERLKIAYNFTFTTGDLRGYGSGSHEISVQYDFVYRVRTVSHRFY